MRRVFIQQKDGDWLSAGAYKASVGFKAVGYDIVPFTVESGFPDLTKADIVHGGVGMVRTALKQLGCPDPPALDLPLSMERFWGRKVWHTTMKAIRGTQRFNPPVHIKPLVNQKAFTGILVRKVDQLLTCTHVDGAEPVLAQEMVNFLSEFRFYVLNREILGVGSYKGDASLFPDRAVIREMVSEYKDSPIAYGLDAGVTDDGRTLPVEWNDAFSLGDYGLHHWEYIRLVEQRWDQMCGSEINLR